MARKDLQQLSEIILDQLGRKSTNFRRMFVDIRVHFFSADEKDVKEQVIAQLEKRSFINEQIPKSIMKIIDEEVPKIVKTMRKLQKSTNSINAETLSSTPTGFLVKLSQSKEGGTANIYSRIGTIKSEAQKSLAFRLDRKIQEFNKRRTASPQREGTLSRRDSSKESKKDFKVDAILLDIGHTEGSAVSEERIERFNDVLFNFNTKTVGAQKFINEILSTAKITLTKTPAKDKQGDKIHDIVVELEASSVNRARADIDSSEADKIQVALTKILDDTNWPSSKGSDTPIDIVGKKALNLFVDKKSKRRKTNITEQKINNRKAKGSAKTKPRKITKAPPYVDKTKVALGAKAAAGARGSRAKSEGTNLPMQQLLGILNQKLPSTVMKNMGPPRLTNQTGRFARSTRATEITKTGQGFPSIGYTYDRNPYQTFELGNPQGTLDYDPRKLIDASIRELAAQFAIGRFYTRRV